MAIREVREMGDDVLDAIVAAGTSLFPYPDKARIQRDIIVNDNDLRGRIQLVKVRRLTHAVSAEIHIGLRLQQQHLLPLDDAASADSLKLLCIHHYMIPIRQICDGVETDIMSCMFVLSGGIPQTCYQIHAFTPFPVIAVHYL